MIRRSVPTRYVLPDELDLSEWHEAGEPLAPWQAAKALRLPLSVLSHALLSGQVPEAVWFLAEQQDGRAVMRYDVAALAEWTATAPVVDTTRPTLPVAQGDGTT